MEVGVPVGLGVAVESGAAKFAGVAVSAGAEVLGVGSATTSGAVPPPPQPLANTTATMPRAAHSPRETQYEPTGNDAVARRAVQLIRRVAVKWRRRTTRGQRDSRCSIPPRAPIPTHRDRQLDPPARAAQSPHQPPTHPPFPAPVR